MAFSVHYNMQAQHRWGIYAFHGENPMNDTLLKLYVKLQTLLSQDEGQDLVEYALVVALIALAATTGMKGLATVLNNAFTSIGSSISTAA